MRGSSSEKKTFLLLIKDGVGNGTCMLDLSINMAKYLVAMVMIIPILSDLVIKSVNSLRRFNQSQLVKEMNNSVNFYLLQISPLKNE
jgi:hypothetical protein